MSLKMTFYGEYGLCGNYGLYENCGNYASCSALGGCNNNIVDWKNLYQPSQFTEIAEVNGVLPASIYQSYNEEKSNHVLENGQNQLSKQRQYQRRYYCNRYNSPQCNNSNNSSNITTTNATNVNFPTDAVNTSTSNAYNNTPVTWPNCSTLAFPRISTFAQNKNQIKPYPQFPKQIASSNANSVFTAPISGPSIQRNNVETKTEQFLNAHSPNKEFSAIETGLSLLSVATQDFNTYRSRSKHLESELHIVDHGSNNNNCKNVGEIKADVSFETILPIQRYNSDDISITRVQPDQPLQSQQEAAVLQGLEVGYNFSQNVLEAGRELIVPQYFIPSNDQPLAKQQSNCFSGRNVSGPLKEQVATHCSSAISPTSNSAIEMKYETQSGPPTAQPHLNSSGVEPPHSNQGTGIVVDGSPADAEDVSALLLSPWSATGSDFLETTDVKQTTAGLQDSWDAILMSSAVNVPHSMPESIKPLPPFTGYTGHLNINGIAGLHYHTIASSTQQRSSTQSTSPTSSSNQEYYESSVVSSSTPCPQGTQKQQQPPPHQQQPQQQPQQQQPQSTQNCEYDDIDDIAEIIGSAIADTTVSGGGNDQTSENDQNTSREWIDIDDWIDNCSPKTQETTSPSSYQSMYIAQQSPTLHNLLTQNYNQALQSRMQSGNVSLQNASCGETPSSTSPYPPVSPPGRVSTSCSPDHHLHSSSTFAAPVHSRKKTRPANSGGPGSKKNMSGNPLQYPDATLVTGKEKPVHRCHICNRGFLNKSNIKVHLRTHTGEKPFRCEVCSKAFRQKAHLIKHQQIHKRIGRD